MSYSISLSCPHCASDVPVEAHSEGATIEVGGSARARMDITYNYGPHFYAEIDKELGLRWLYGQKAGNTIPRLAAAVKKLGTERDDDYWAATPGNAGHALNILLNWAAQHPSARWDGD